MTVSCEGSYAPPAGAASFPTIPSPTAHGTSDRKTSEPRVTPNPQKTLPTNHPSPSTMGSARKWPGFSTTLPPEHCIFLPNNIPWLGHRAKKNHWAERYHETTPHESLLICAALHARGLLPPRTRSSFGDEVWTSKTFPGLDQQMRP